MNGASLSARIAYAVVVIPLSGLLAFYVCMLMLPDYAASHPQLDPGMDGYGIFQAAVCVAGALSGTLGLLVLTLPSIRHRKRSGRGWRTAASAVVVVAFSLLFADQGLGLVLDLVFAVWLTYTMAFTFVRYGVVDEGSVSSPTKTYD